jgi:hypothetical protein
MIHLVRFAIQNMTSGPYLAAIHRILVSVMLATCKALGLAGYSSRAAKLQQWGAASITTHTYKSKENVDKPSNKAVGRT